MRSNRFATGTVALALAASLAGPQPALADGAASTRNIIFGAAAVGGTLLILNHNKKVHERYAESAKRQATSEAERNQAEAAYESERGAYNNEVALVSEYRRETAYQHRQIVARDREIASLEHSLVVAKYGRSTQRTAYVGAAPHRVSNTAHTPARRIVAHRSAPHVAVQRARPVTVAHREVRPETVSYGWGNY